MLISETFGKFSTNLDKKRYIYVPKDNETYMQKSYKKVFSINPPTTVKIR